MGHFDRNGGGKINPFGIDFREADYTWSTEFCRKDSDGDGETNGMELGDPCCLWVEGAKPSRSWQLSRPGDNESKSTHPAVNCTALRLDFEKFYYAGADEYVEQNLISWIFEQVGFAILHPINTTLFIKDFVLPTGDDGEPKLRSTKNTSSSILLVCLIIYAYLGTFSDIPKMTRRQLLSLLAVALVWTDLASFFVHVVLDNPVLNNWPLIGPEAAAFQGHHYDPSAITRGPWHEFLREHHILAVVLTVSVFANPSYGPLRVFVVMVNILLHFMMAAHRWSHMLPSRVPTAVRLLQGSLFISQTHHSSHHSTYDNNFAIFTGWCNPMMNFICANVMSHTNPNWFWLFCIYSFTPLFFSLKPVRSYMGNLFDQLSLEMNVRYPKNGAIQVLFPLKYSKDSSEVLAALKVN